MFALRFLIVLILASNSWAASTIFPLKDVRAGQHGTGRTIFNGDRIEDFDVEILGVLDNMGPGQSIILAKLSGGPLEKTGVIQGMSGSPVYIDGKLLGAVALAFPFSKDPIAGIRPIQDMLPLGDSAPTTRRAAMPKSTGDMLEISTPLSLNGFTAATLEHFSPDIRKLGLEPRQGVSSGGKIPPGMGKPSELHPGDMITVQLLSGDLNMGADGTVTEVNGNQVYAFGHRFLDTGGTELPFAKAKVITTLANLSSSFKISAAREWMGTITEDRSTSIFGELGRKAATIPVTLEMSGARNSPRTYKMEMVNDRVLSPFILQMAIFSAIDATERTVGSSSFVLRGEVEFQSGAPPLKIDNAYAGEFGVPQQAALGIASPVSYLFQSGFDSLKIKGIHLAIDSTEKKQLWQVDQLAVSRKEIHPGDTIDLAITLAGENGAEIQRTIQYKVPIGAPTGALQFTVADATATNLAEFAQTIGIQPKSPQQVVGFLNALHSNNRAYVRVWRSDASFQAGGAELPDPPPSIALLLAKSQSTPQNSWLGRGSTVAQMQIDTGDGVVSGSKTVQVDVKE